MKVVGLDVRNVTVRQQLVYGMLPRPDQILVSTVRSNPQRSIVKTRLSIAALGLSLALSGCKCIGPGSVPRDRSDYSDAISESWKRQTLLNIVKLRYLDPPIFVDVGQIVAGYQLQVGGTVGGQISSQRALQGNSLNLGGAATFIDRPTITYTPLTGNKFIKGLMTPLPAGIGVLHHPIRLAGRRCALCYGGGDQRLEEPGRLH